MQRTFSSALSVVALGASLLLGACDSGERLTPEELEAKIVSRLDDANKRLLNNKAGDAENIYKWVLEQKPNHPGALRGLGEVRMDSGDWAGAEEFLTKAVTADPSDARAQAKLGEALSQQEKWEPAVGPLGKAFELENDNAAYGLAYGVALRQANKFAEAEKVLKQTSELDDQIQYVWTELADAQRAQGQLDVALKTYMKAQNTYRGDERAHAGAGFVYEEQGQVSLAIDQWSAYVRMDCCSNFSDEVAKPKLEELRKRENEAPPEEGDDAAG